MLQFKCNSRKEEVQKQSPRQFSAAYSVLNCGITEIAESLATKHFILHQRSARAGFQQAQTFFPSPVLFFLFLPPFVNNTKFPLYQRTTALVLNVPLCLFNRHNRKVTTHQAKITVNLFLPSPYHLSAAIIPHPWGKDPICGFQKPPQ